MIEDGLVTETSKEQHALEQRVAKLYSELVGLSSDRQQPSLEVAAAGAHRVPV